MPQTLTYPKILDTNTELFPASIFFSFFERRNVQQSELAENVMLFMPKDFGQPSTVSWDTFKAAEAILGVGSEMTSIGSSGGFIGMAIGAMRAHLGGAANDLADLISVNSGHIMNPYLTQIFRGVDFRNFAFEFNLTPFEPSDCDLIKQIINTFRKWALPDGEAGGTILGYPGEVEIEYKFEGDTNPYLHKFKRSVITNVDVSYTGTGMFSMMRNGMPSETVLKLSFSEIEIVTRKDVVDNDY